MLLDNQVVSLDNKSKKIFIGKQYTYPKIAVYCKLIIENLMKERDQAIKENLLLQGSWNEKYNKL